MPKYMLIMRGTDETHEAVAKVPFEQVMEAMGRLMDDMIRAGVLLAAEGLDPAEHTVIDYSGETPVVTDGPYGETHELFGGYFIVDVGSKDEAIEWAKKIPTWTGGKTEVRRVAGIEEFPQDNEWIVKERAWRERTGQL